jgi:hypothetical protein
MHLVHEPGKMAGWIAPPARGTHGLPGEFVHVRRWRRSRVRRCHPRSAGQIADPI